MRRPGWTRRPSPLCRRRCDGVILHVFVRRGLIEKCDADEMAGWDHGGGFSVDAAVRIEGNDRAGLERLLRYCARPPFALEHLHQSDAEHLVYHCPTITSQSHRNHIASQSHRGQVLQNNIPRVNRQSVWICECVLQTDNGRSGIVARRLLFGHCRRWRTCSEFSPTSALRMPFPRAAAGQFLPHTISTNPSSERPLFLETCRRANSIHTNRPNI